MHYRRNNTLFSPRHDIFMPAITPKSSLLTSRVLAWPAWLRLLAVAPALLLLWLAVLWASMETAPL